jgi:hypothetical protein
MRTSGATSENQMTWVILAIAIAFLMVLAGGPSQFVIAIERTLEAGAAALFQVYQSLRA